MYDITKGIEPNSLTAYKMLPDAQYDGPDFKPVKDDVRSQVLLEQGFTCAYCMQRISPAQTKIEHWACQDRNPNFQLSYQNLLGCCKGNEGSSPKGQTCDTKKGNSDLKYSPADPMHMILNRIRYAGDGMISSPDPDFDIELNTVLNLNYARLKSNRHAAIKSVQKKLNNKEGTRNKAVIQRLIEKYKMKNADNKFTPFYGAIIGYLHSKI
jgi:uncharacterized protein (TIGR02646 family)